MINPGAIATGALTGLGAGVIGAIPLISFGWADTSTIGGQMLLICVGFAAQFGAGWVGARIAGRSEGLHGGLTALALHTIISFIALASRQDPSLFTVASGAVIALTLGTAAGVLVQARHG